MGRAICFVISALILFIAVAVALQVGIAVSGQVIGGVAPEAGAQMYGPVGWGVGLGFALIMSFLFIALMVGLVSAFFRGGHRRDGRWIDHRRTMLEEWHRQAHGETARADRPA